tara:strand:+ start:89 stop:631 length:543 start_codon:yes stop_codon:yes gene_type:complete
MFNIQRKDMPLKGWITTYETIINDPEMDKEIKKIIDKQGDRQNKQTNVKAQMTEWNMKDQPGFKKLGNIAINIAKKATIDKYLRDDYDFKIFNIWGMKYKSGDQAMPHDHWPALWSFAYYLNAPKDAPGLFFPNMGEQGGERKLEKGLFVMFDGYIKHAVRPAEYKGYRYVVSGNLYEEV